jgi:hypothetical protein
MWNVNSEVDALSADWYHSFVALPLTGQWEEHHWNAAYLDKVRYHQSGTGDENTLCVYLLDLFMSTEEAHGIAPIDRLHCALSRLDVEQRDGVCLLFNLYTLRLIARCLEEDSLLDKFFYFRMRDVIRYCAANLV